MNFEEILARVSSASGSDGQATREGLLMLLACSVDQGPSAVHFRRRLFQHVSESIAYLEPGKPDLALAAAALLSDGPVQVVGWRAGLASAPGSYWLERARWVATGDDPTGVVADGAGVHSSVEADLASMLESLDAQHLGAETLGELDSFGSSFDPSSRHRRSDVVEAARSAAGIEMCHKVEAHFDASLEEVLFQFGTDGLLFAGLGWASMSATAAGTRARAMLAVYALGGIPLGPGLDGKWRVLLPGL